MLRISAYVLLLLSINLPCFQKAAHAQNGHDEIQKENDNKLVIDSVPRDAHVEISGKYSFVGRTPFTVPYKLYGKYKIKARKNGYETYTATVNLGRRGANLITLRLDRKTRFSAAYRSFLLPGWGQFYGQDKFKGFLVSFTQVSLAIGTAVMLDNYDQQKKKYELALRSFQQISNNYDEAVLAFDRVEKTYQTAKDAQDLRNMFVSATVGFWVYNILDSMIFFSSHKKINDNSTWYRPDLTGQILPDEVWLTMNFRF